jgi:hypothetical protein
VVQKTIEGGEVQIGAPVPDCPHQAILEAWKAELPAMPQHEPGLWRGARQQNLGLRWREVIVDLQRKQKPSDRAAGMRYFRKLFGWIGQSAYLTGRAPTPSPGRRPFVIELAWLVKHENWVKVIEGKYHEDH